MLAVIQQFLKQLMPEKNVICGYLGGLFVAVIVHFLVAAQVNLDATQAASLAAFVTGLVAHLWDSVVKTIIERKDEKAADAASPPEPPKAP